MSPQRVIGGAAGWAGFGVALGVLLALSGSRAAQAAPSPGGIAARLPAQPAATTVPATPPRATGRSRPTSAAARLATRALVTFVAHVAAGIVLALVLVLTIPLAFGMRPLVVLSGSMEPVLHVGDVTVVERIAPREARVGDVVTFKAPESGRVTTHRLRAVRRSPDGRFAFTTKGDANNSIERWTLPADGQLSRAVHRVPSVGHVLLLIATPLGWALLVGLPLLVLGIQEIVRIWRRAPEVGDASLAH